MIERGYLVKRTDGEKTSFYWRAEPSNPDCHLSRLSLFEDFTINYGVDFSQLEDRNGILYYKDTDKECYLISGPYMELIGDVYQDLSAQMYEDVKKAKLSN